MRIRVDYTTIYEYQSAASDVLQLLRLMPTSHAAQHVLHWRIDTDTDCHLRRSEDSFGNITHMLYPDGPIRRLQLHVSGEVDTIDTAGQVPAMDVDERLPPPVFLRQTATTAPDDAIKALASAVQRPDALATAHALNNTLYSQMRFDADVTHAASNAVSAWGMRAGVCQDYAHIFLSAARVLGMPARYVSGHLVRHDGLITQPATHAWAEALIPGLGWVGFDPTNGMCPTESYLRVAVGLDYLDAAPVRGARRGGGAETMNVAVTTTATGPNQQQGQIQTQA